MKEFKVKSSEEIKELTSANITAMKSTLENQGGVIAKLVKEVEAKTEGETVSFKSAIYNALTEKAEELKSLSESSQKNIRLDIKASHHAATTTVLLEILHLVLILLICFRVLVK